MKKKKIQSMKHREFKKSFGVFWEDSLIGLAFVSTEGRFLEINPAFCELLGYSESELLSMSFQDITHPQDLNDDLHMTDKIKLGEIDNFMMTKRYITKFGNTVWIKIKVNGIYTDDGGTALGYFLAQVLPFEVHYSDNNIERSMPEEPYPAVSFMKANWKWILGTIGSVVFAAGGAYIKQDVAVKTLQNDVVNMKRDISSINDNLDVIMELLKQ